MLRHSRSKVPPQTAVLGPAWLGLHGAAGVGEGWKERGREVDVIKEQCLASWLLLGDPQHACKSLGDLGELNDPGAA